MEIKPKYQAFEAFRPHFNALARVGYFKLVPKSESLLKNKFHFAYRIAMWIIVVTYNLQHIIKVIQERHSTQAIINILFILLTTLNTLGKQMAFNFRSKRIDHVINIISGPLFAAHNSHHEAVMKANAATMRGLLRFYNGSVLTCGAMWTIFPLVNRAMEEEVQFTAYFPLDTNKSPIFELIVAYMNIFITFQALGNVTMDCTIVAFYAQARVQLQIIRQDLEHLTDRKKEDNVRENVEFTSKKDIKRVEFNRVVQRRFVQCILRHQKVKWFILEIESIFAESLTFLFFVTAWVICMTVYKIVGLNLLSAEFLSMVIYLCCMLAQLFIYCYYGTQVKYESEYIVQSAYCSDWVSLPPRFRRQLLMLMEACKRPIAPRTAYVIPISLETYIAVLRASYTLYTFLDRK